MKENFEIVAIQNSNLALDLASYLNKKIIVPQIEDFADTETLIKISNTDIIKNKVIFVVQQFFFFHKNNSYIDPINNQLFKLLLLVDYLKKAGAKKIVCILPYLPYSRQNKTACGKYFGAAFLLGKLFKHAGLDRVVCFDLHEPGIKLEFETELENVKLDEFWVDFLKSKFKDEIFKFSLVSPDMGRIAMVKNIAKLLGISFAYIEKKRIGIDRSVSIELFGNVNKNVIVIDDIVDTAKTAINTCNLLVKKDAKKIIGCFSHAVMTNDAKDKLESSLYEEIFLTDTVPVDSKTSDSKKIFILSVKDFLCNYIKQYLSLNDGKF